MRSPCTNRQLRRQRAHLRAAVLLFYGVCLTASTSNVLAQVVPTDQPLSDPGLTTFISEASERFHIPGDWIRAVMHAESGHPHDVSSAGAMGLMQIMPDTWSGLRLRYGLGTDPFDPHDNIIAGAAYLRELLDRYGNAGAMLAAYNAGPGRYDDYIETGRPLPIETRNYVAKLAPVLTGVVLPGSVPTLPSALPDWREAPLFVAVAGSRSVVGPLQPDGRSAATPTPALINGDANLPASTGGIFVPVNVKRSTR